MMTKKIFKAEKLDQMKERTTNMFSQCGTSGTVSPQQYETRSREREFRISTLECTYRTPHFADVPRHCVSDSNIFMHRDMDWYREPRPLSYEYDAIQPAPIPSDRGRVETFTTRVQTPGNVLVRFKTFLGMDGSTVEVVTDNSDYIVKGSARSEENALMRMKNLFTTRGRQYTIDENNVTTEENRTSDISKFDKMKNIFKTKPSVDTTQQITETVVGPAEKIVRMKTFFANRPPRNTVVIESTTTSSYGVKKNFDKIKTLFKTDTGSQTDDIPSPTPPVEENPRNNKGKFKKLLGITKGSKEGRGKDEHMENIDDRQIFSRQSSIPAQVIAQEDDSMRLPIWMDNFVKRVRASCSRARVNDIEIPSAVVIDPHEDPVTKQNKRRKFGSASGWRWRRGDEVRTERRRSSNKCWNPKNCALPVCPLPKLSFGSSTQDGQEVPIPFTQVIALICGILVVVLMALGLSSADWLMAAGWRQGLFTHCVEEGAPTPLPFNLVEQPGCYASREVAYIRAAAALCIVTLCADLLGSLLTGLGLRATDHRTKYKYYRLAVLAMSLALISILIALVIYPVCFAAELNLGNRTVWEFGWAYGVGWGAAIFLFGAVILLLCDKESEEIYYKERKVERAQPPGGA